VLRREFLQTIGPSPGFIPYFRNWLLFAAQPFPFLPMAYEILAPTDFSLASETSYSYARMMAHFLNARLDVLHVFGVPASSKFQSIQELEDKETQALQAARAKMAEFIKRMKTSTPFVAPSEHHLVKFGIAFEQVLNLTEHVPYSMVIMGTKGANNVETKLFGTNTSTLLSDSPIPILAVPEGYPVAQPRTILAALEPNNTDLGKLDLLKCIADALGAQLYVLSLTTNHSASECTHFLQKVHTALQMPRMKVAVREANDVIEGIYEAVDEVKADLLVMVQHKRGFFERFFSASVTNKVVTRPHLPVLALRQ
jgi:nucleotide-binding universal stress UspA family protein